ncbi:MAG: glycosyltransferase [Bacteroidales bacterium]|nr:glycosyltransferase [Bacteroidales bacterium]
MLSKEISESVLTVGNRSDKPDGGIAQVLYSYRQHVYPVFNHVVNFKRGGFFYKMLVTLWGFIQMFFILLINRKIRIVHIHTAADNGFKRNIAFVYLAYAMGKKVILHIHSGRFNEYYERNKHQVDKVFAKCASIVVLTQGFKEFYENKGWKNVTVINNIIEYPEFRDVKKEDEAIHYLYLGVITKTKGIYDLLDIIIGHKEEFRGKLVLHVGGNKEVDTLVRMIKDNGIEDIVKFEGWVSGDKKVELLNLCEVFILPSYTEGVPISILEAQSYGDFVVATNVGGIPEIVNETNGMLFSPQDKESLYHILKVLDADRSILKAKNAIMESSKYYLPEFVSVQLENLYKGLLNN